MNRVNFIGQFIPNSQNMMASYEKENLTFHYNRRIDEVDYWGSRHLTLESPEESIRWTKENIHNDFYLWLIYED
jgi:hypothetical protein